MGRTRKRDRELFVLESCLSRIWGSRTVWEIVTKQERPDFIVRAPEGHLLGVEVTELLTPEQGEERSLDGRLNTVAIEVMTAWLAEGGERGAFVIGRSTSVPSRSEDLDPFRRAFRMHLDLHGERVPRKLRVPFQHRWGAIEAIGPWELPEIYLSGSGWGPPLDYMAGRPSQEIEGDVVDAVKRKVEQARSYKGQEPLWLVVRNPNQGLAEVQAATKGEVREFASATFRRVVLANIPVGTRDPFPPFPHNIDLL